MQTFSNSDILEIWGNGRCMHPLDRGLLALSVTVHLPQTDLRNWTLGRRNRALLELHSHHFGSSLKGWSACTDCGERLEFEVHANAFIAGPEQEPETKENVVIAGERFRIPTSRDLAETVVEEDEKKAAILLLESCRLTREKTIDWSDSLLDEAGEVMASADPLAEIRLNLQCPTCNCASDEALDISSFVWAEIESRAKRLVWEVHSLATAYGWTETETLSLPAARRALYLEIVNV